MAMRGDAINVSNIAKIVEGEIGNLSERITEITDNWESKKKTSPQQKGDLGAPLRKGFLF